MTIDVKYFTGVNPWLTECSRTETYVSNFDDLSIKDIKMLADLPKISSIRSYAKSKDVSAASISKRLKSIEEKLSIEILDRSALGVSITSQGFKVTNWARELLKTSIDNSDLFNSQLSRGLSEIIIGTRGFLNISTAPAFIKTIGAQYNLKFIDLSPNDTLQLIRNKKLDITISFQPHKYGEDWNANYIGKMEWAILKNKNFKTPKQIKLEDLKKYSIVQATYYDGTTIITGEDFLDVPKIYKRFGYGVQTAQTAISVALCSEQLIYVPKICASNEIEKGNLEIIKIRDHQDFSNEVYLHYNIDKFRTKEIKSIENELKTHFN